MTPEEHEEHLSSSFVKITFVIIILIVIGVMVFGNKSSRNSGEVSFPYKAAPSEHPMREVEFCYEDQYGMPHRDSGFIFGTSMQNLDEQEELAAIDCRDIFAGSTKRFLAWCALPHNPTLDFETYRRCLKAKE